MVKIEISSSALDYLKSLARPLEDTTVSVVDRLVKEHQLKHGDEHQTEAKATLNFGIADMPNVTHTSISSASIDKKPLIKKDWNTVLGTLIESSSKKVSSISDLIALLDANIIPSKPSESDKQKGFRYLPEAGLSFQGLDAIRACRNIMKLSQEFSIPVNLTIKWSQNPQGEFPGKTATLTLP